MVARGLSVIEKLALGLVTLEIDSTFSGEGKNI